MTTNDTTGIVRIKKIDTYIHLIYIPTYPDIDRGEINITSEEVINSIKITKERFEKCVLPNGCFVLPNYINKIYNLITDGVCCDHWNNYSMFIFLEVLIKFMLNPTENLIKFFEPYLDIKLFKLGFCSMNTENGEKIDLYDLDSNFKIIINELLLES